MIRGDAFIITKKQTDVNGFLAFETESAKTQKNPAFAENISILHIFRFKIIAFYGIMWYNKMEQLYRKESDPYADTEII